MNALALLWKRLKNKIFQDAFWCEYCDIYIFRGDRGRGRGGRFGSRGGLVQGWAATNAPTPPNALT